MKLELARSAGFCYGVRRAVEMAEQAARSGCRCVMLGPVIHNGSVIERLKAQGVALAETPEQVPEGAAVSLPLLQKGESKKRAFFAGAASGLVEPVGALLALALAGWVSAALPWLMSAAAGCMVCVTAQEMIPEAVENDEPAGVISVVLGFALMMALDVAL